MELSPPGMMFSMELFQPLARNVGIDLRGRNVGVAQQHLYDAQIGAMVEKMRSERVAQHMR